MTINHSYVFQRTNASRLQDYVYHATLSSFNRSTGVHTTHTEELGNIYRSAKQATLHHQTKESSNHRFEKLYICK